LSIKAYGSLYWVIVGVLTLLIASPFLNRVLVYPRTEFFTELWILNSSHRAESYPFNITQNRNYTIYLGIRNHLGYCAYYMVQVKFRNQTQPEPTRFGPLESRSPSNLTSLFNITAFVADNQVWETPITFSFNYTHNETLSRIEFSSLLLNNVWLSMTDYTIILDSEKNEFRGFLFFELWLFNTSANAFQYHGRYVSLRLNITAS
jgi:hypothetical protein